LFILLTTINPHQEISFNKFNLKKIEIENNSLLDEKEIKKLLVSINNKNLIFLKFKEIENALMKNNFIEGFNIKKKYPNTLKIKIFEKKPIAILINKKKKILSE
jgi:cell division protein FtsQ